MRVRDQAIEGQMQKHVILMALSHGWAATREPQGASREPARSNPPMHGNSRGGGCPGPSGDTSLLRNSLSALFLTSPAPLCNARSLSHAASAPYLLSQPGIYRGHSPKCPNLFEAGQRTAASRERTGLKAWNPAAAPQLVFRF